MESLFDLNQIPAITAKPSNFPGKHCRDCKHNEPWQCGSRIIHYCGIRKSNRTQYGQLKIRCKDDACAVFSPCC